MAPKKRHRNPKGGLTAAGRAYYNRRGSNLRPSVKRIRTNEDRKRRGSFLVRHYGGKAKPLKDLKGRLTRHSRQARAWGESAPTTQAQARKLATKGRRLLAEYYRRKKRR